MAILRGMESHVVLMLARVLSQNESEAQSCINLLEKKRESSALQHRQAIQSYSQGNPYVVDKLEHRPGVLCSMAELDMVSPGSFSESV